MLFNIIHAFVWGPNFLPIVYFYDILVKLGTQPCTWMMWIVLDKLSN